MSQSWLAWSAIGLYALVTAALVWRGWRRTKSLESFAVGSGDISPVVVGLSLAAQLTSVATFVVNPGLVFAYGLSGLLGFGLAAGLGILAGLIVFSRAFRRVGTRVAALSVPGWIGKRFDSRPLGTAFGVLSLGLIAYAVLIVVALAYVLGVLLGLPPSWLALAVIVFVFSTVLLGGANTHAYTNAIQAGVMLVVALLLVGQGLPTLWRGDGLMTTLAAMDPNLVGATNPASPYFRNLFEVFVCNFVVGLAIVCQPHILSKALYLKDEAGLRRMLGVAVGVGVVFMGVMLVGLFARLELPAGTPIDRVVPAYIGAHFSAPWQVLISIGVLCAGISTLEGILLALSAITSVDLYLGLVGRGAADEARRRRALRVGRLSIVVFGAATYGLARWQIADPTGGSVAIFAQYGVYSLAAASFVPLAAGMFLPQAHRLAVTAAAAVSVLAFVGSALLPFSEMANNPAFLAVVAVAAGWATFGIGQLLARWRLQPVLAQAIKPQ